MLQVFLPWSDPAWYASAPDGELEAGGAGWTLRTGAKIVPGNESFFVGSTLDRLSLRLVPGASASTPRACIGPGHPTVRFFVRNEGAPEAALRVAVEFTDPSGLRRSVPIGIVTGTREWAPSPVLPVVTNTLAAIFAQQAAFRFTPEGGGSWSVDDLYIDPYGKG